MKKSILIAGALLVLGASAAAAAGINLSWRNCGTAGVDNETFACDVNTGSSFVAVGSFDPPTGVTEFVGISAQIDILTDQAALPEWWKHRGTGCRGTSGLSVGFDFVDAPPMTPCTSAYPVLPSGDFLYFIGAPTAARAVMRIQAAIAVEQRIPLPPGVEYYAFKANFSRLKSTGVGSCAGCASQACLVLNEIQLFQPEGVGDPKINNPLNRQYVTFQSPATGPVGCPLSVPTKNRTWGQVKSLYR